MKNIQSRLLTVDWQKITEQMNKKGYAIISGLLSHDQCEEIIGNYDKTNLYRKTIVMERYRFGKGEYKYFNYPLPGLIQAIRENVYPHLATIANCWMKLLNIDNKFPDTFAGLQTLCHTNNQRKPAVVILKYGEGGHNTLHQDLYGNIFFPVQAVLFLNQPGEDFTGGEFVLTEQTPRAQSKAIVLNPKKGDMLIFTTNFRPVKGSRGYFRVSMKHGVSEVHNGDRHTLGIIFHDALN